MDDVNAMRQDILSRIDAFHKMQFPAKPFIAGQTPIPVTGKVFDADEMRLLVDASLDFWLTTGRYAAQFERELAQWVGTRFALLCNSGSSANLLAMTALTSPLLKDRRLKCGDEVITVAAGFPTTVNPIVQNQLIPVFVDIEPHTANVNVQAMQDAIGPRTKAIVLAHSLGNPFNIKEVMLIARKYNLWLIEDNCDALGSVYEGQKTGTFGDMATLSFYPAHHITLGEGGAVLTSNAILNKALLSLRDWGRDCWCEPGHDNTCGKRFDWQLGGLPEGYDHKYIYSHIGYNLKATDMQAAVGVAQLKKLPQFIQQRQHNWRRLSQGLNNCGDIFVLPQATVNSIPSWFGFLLSVKPNGIFTRRDIVTHLESQRIATRQFFGGNLLKQPAYKDLQCRVAGDLTHSDALMNNGFWIGVYPGLSDDMIDYMIETIGAFVKRGTCKI